MLKHITKGETSYIGLCKKIYHIVRYVIKWIWFYHKFGRVGLHTNIKKPLIVRNVKNVYIGDRVGAEPGLRIQTYNKYNDQVFHPSIRIGDGVIMSQFVEIIATDELVIEDCVSIGQFAMINTSIHGYMEKDVPVIKQDLISKPIHIGYGSHIGAGAMILPGANIGKFCVIGANCVINKPVSDYTVVSPQRPRTAVLPYAVRKQMVSE